MRLIADIEQSELDAFISASSQAEFLQSYGWGEFQEQAGNDVFRVAIEEQDKIIAAATFIKKPLFAGKYYLYCPRGPVVIENLRLSIDDLLEYIIRELSKKYDNLIFIRIELKKINRKSKIDIRKSISIQPKTTSIIDLSKSEDEILKSMHPKTRYNIRLAEKRGVAVRDAGAEDFQSFWNLMEDTKTRDGFRLHSGNYYQKMINAGQSGGLKIKLYLAEWKGKVLAGGIFAFFGDTAYYIHGASSNIERNVMAPYLLHWSIIRYAKEIGCKFYDLYGIDENRWPGVTRFKLGFGGETKEYAGTFDVVINRKWYGLYELLRKLRRLVK